jgi:hypothetical protein
MSAEMAVSGQIDSTVTLFPAKNPCSYFVKGWMGYRFIELKHISHEAVI